MDLPIRQSDCPDASGGAYHRRVTKTAMDKIAASRHKEFVGRQLVLAREAIGRTQTQLAREFGMKASNKLNQWERGLYYPEPWFLKQLSDHYGFTMDFFYRGVRAGVSSERVDDLRRAEAGKMVA